MSELVSGPRGEMASLPYEPDKKNLALKAIDKLLTGKEFQRCELIEEPFISPAPSWQTKFLGRLVRDKAIVNYGRAVARKYKMADRGSLNSIRAILLETEESVVRHGYGNTFVLTDSLKNYLDGHLLGDGHYSKINSGGMCSAFQLEQCIAHSSWVIAAQQRLSIAGVESKITHHSPRLLPKNAGPTLLLRTKTYRTLKAERLRWYPNGKKIVPLDIHLEDPELLAQWYMGDGACQPECRRLLLSTCCFTEEENVYLRDRLGKLLGNQVYVCHMNGYPMIGIKGKATEGFLNLVRPYLDPCFAFKSRSVWTPHYCVECGVLIELRLRFARYCIKCTPYKKRISS